MSTNDEVSSETAAKTTDIARETDASAVTSESRSSRTTAADGQPEESDGEDSAAQTSTRTEDASGDVVVVTDVTAFTTPAQAAYCLLGPPTQTEAASISCEVAQSSVPPDEPLMGVCAAEGIGWFFNFFADTGHGGFFCNHPDGIANGAGQYWSDQEWINPDSIAVLDNGVKVAILDYGRVLRAGDLRCSVQPDGLTCNDPGTGHGFTVNTASYVSW